MKIGVTLFPDHRGMPIPDLAREVEARGFESLWVPEHTNIPVSRHTRWPGARPGAEELPEYYRRFADPIVSLTAAAAATERLILGTGVCIVSQRDPIVLAKQVASFVELFGARFVLGVGIGWNVEEMQNHGIDPATRWERTRETVEALRVLWTREEAAYAGRHVRFEPTWVFPKPSAPPEIHLGGGFGPRLLREAARWADGWMPISARESLRDRIELLWRACDEVGRARETLRIGVFGAAERRRAADSLAREGVSRMILTHYGENQRDALLRHLDAWASEFQDLLQPDGSA